MKSAISRTSFCLLGAVLIGCFVSLSGGASASNPGFDDLPKYVSDNIPSYKAESLPAYSEVYEEIPDYVGMKRDCNCTVGDPCTCGDKCNCAKKGNAISGIQRMLSDTSFLISNAVGCKGKGRQASSQASVSVETPIESFQVPVTTVPSAGNLGYSPVVVAPVATEAPTMLIQQTYCNPNGGPCTTRWVRVPLQKPVLASALAKAGDKCPCCDMVMTADQAAVMNAKKAATLATVASPVTYQSPVTYTTSFGSGDCSTGNCASGSGDCSTGNCASGAGGRGGVFSFGILGRRRGR